MQIVQEQIWYVDDRDHTRLERHLDVPRESGWRIAFEGDVNLNVDVDFPPGLTHDERVAQGLSTTAFHCVNAVPLLCDTEEPGFKTFLDLKMIMGCMGTYELR
jgi:hypothetical protein